MRCLLLLLISCTLYSADFIRDYRRSGNLLVYPPDQKECGTKTAEGYRLSRPAALHRQLSAYGYVILPEKCIGLSGRLRYQASSANGHPESVRMTLFFNRKNGGNGSAGSIRFQLPQSPEIRDFRFETAVPDNAAVIQVAFALPNGKAEILVQKLEITWIKDQAEVKRVPAGTAWKQAPSTWKERGMQPFYNLSTGKIAHSDTQVKFRFDDDALYAGFIASEPEMKFLAAKIKEHDGPVWKDDCLELFVYDPSKSRGWQFAVNPAGTRFEGILHQRVPGDPYRTRKEWNGAWEASVFRKADRWEAVLKIPWKTLECDTVPQGKLLVNAARERKPVTENSHMLTSRGQFSAVDRFAEIDFQENPVRIVRSRTVENISYVPTRQNPVFEEAFSSEKGDYRLGAFPFGIYKREFPPALQNRADDEVFRKWQERLLSAWMNAKMCGPILPWAEFPRNLMGMEKLKKLNQRAGMKFPYVVWEAAPWAAARAAKLKLRHFIDESKLVDPSDPAFLQLTENMIRGLSSRIQKDPDYRKMLAFILGVDEPTNVTMNCFSLTKNPKAKTTLEETDRQIRDTTGFGKFGLYDSFVRADSQTPFRRIAFWRWWNLQFRNFLTVSSRQLHEQIPEVPFLGYTRNTTAGMDMTDIALLSPETDLIGCDPYPTSTAALYGMPRAVYHTGFSVKITADLAAQSEVCVMPQSFVYYETTPSRADIREWAAQALKNGARHFYWFTGYLAVLHAPEAYSEMLAMNRRISAMNKLDIPRESAIGILFSEYDKWGLGDAVGHTAYTVYAILGEHLGSWFRFVSQSTIRQNRTALERFRLLIVPRLRFCDRETLAALRSFLDKGGTLVVLDPGFLRFNIDGTEFPEREQWLGGTHLVRKKSDAHFLNTPEGKQLALSKVRNLADGEENGILDAWDFTAAVPGAAILASYPDGKAAIIRRRHGNGTLILSAVQPFGDSSAAVNPGEWTAFFRKLAAETGEVTDRPLWRFTIPGGKTPAPTLELPF